MNSTLKPALVLFLALLAAPFAAAQVTLHDFTAFESTDTFFVGDWELNGDAGGTNSPRQSFSQGAGFYNFAGGSNDETASALHFFAAPVDITGLTLLEISAALLQDNTAESFAVTLFDVNGNGASATFLTADFAGGGFATVGTLFTGVGFDASQLGFFQISGNVAGGTDILSLAIDHLAVSAPITAVPEPSTYGALAALALIGLIAAKRFRVRT